MILRRLKYLLAGAGLSLLLALGLMGAATAHSFHTGTNVVLGQGEAIHQTVFAAGSTVDISREVYGDVFCAGQNVTVSATVHGDVLCAGQTVHVTGKIEGNVRLAGQTVTLGADVSGNATIGGQTFTLESTSKIGGDLTLGSATASLNGAVGRDVLVGGSNVTISSTVGRNVKGSVETLLLTASARVAGNVDYTSKNLISAAEGSVVGGAVTRTEPPQQAKDKHFAVLGFGIAWFVYWFFASLLIALAFALLFPRVLHSVSGKAIKHPVKSALVGLLACATVPVIIVILFFTLVGIPLGLLLSLLWLVVLLLSWPFTAFYLGRLLMRKAKNSLLIMLVGASVLLVALFLPIIGMLVAFATVLLGTGMFLLEVMQRTPKPEYSIEV